MKMEPSTTDEQHARRSSSKAAHSASLDGRPDSKTTLLRCWTDSEVQLAWTSDSADSVSDCHWQSNGKLPSITCQAVEWSKSNTQRLTSEDFIAYEGTDGCNQLQHLLNCDSYYMVIEAAQSTDQSATAYVDLMDGNVVHQN